MRSGGIGYGAALAGAFACAVWVRISGWAQVFVGDRVLTHDPDALYHLHRIGETLRSFPHVPVWDPYLNWPEGGPCPWAPGFDWLAAAFVWLSGAAGDPLREARVASFFPVLLGLAVVAIAVAIARRLAPRTGAGDLAVVTAAWLAALLPRGGLASQVGRVDHHVAEAAMMAALGWGVLWALGEDPERPRARRQWLAFEAGAAALVTLSGWIFSGSVLYVAIAVAVWIALRLDAPRERARLWGSGFPGLAVASLALLAIHAGLVAQHGHRLDFRFPSYLQPALHGVLALACLAGAAAIHRVGGATPAARVARRIGWLALAGGLVGAAALPWIGAAAWAGLAGWVAHGDPWLAGIAEFQPLLPSWALWRPEAWAALYHFNGRVGMLAPVAIPLGLWSVARRDRRTGAALAGFALPLAILTLVQNRFGQVLTPWYAVVAGAAVAALAGPMAARAIARVPRAPATPLALPGLAAAVLLVAVLAPDRVIRDELRRGSPRVPTAIEAASLYLSARAATPQREGVLAAWYYGHTLRVLGGRPVLTAGFGPWTGAEGFEASQRFAEGSEAELLALMRARRLGFVVTGMNAPLPGPRDPAGNGERPFRWDASAGRAVLDPQHFRQRPLAPLVVGGSGMPGFDVEHVAHLRPVFASAWSLGVSGLPVFQLWVYERVAGARVEGRAPPGARVVARTRIEVHGARLPYTTWTRADAGGAYRLVIPLPSGVQDGPLTTGPAYDLFVDDTRRGSVVVSEAAVRGGAAVAPHL